jgi:hypothetical protein
MRLAALQGRWAEVRALVLDGVGFARSRLRRGKPPRPTPAAAPDKVPRAEAVGGPSPPAKKKRRERTEKKEKKAKEGKAPLLPAAGTAAGGGGRWVHLPG